MTDQRSQFISIAPLVPTGVSLSEAVSYYTEQLGFVVEWTGGSMAGIRRGAIVLNLVENDSKEWIENSSYSIGVSNLDALYEEYRKALVKVTPPEVKFWGRREFHMIAPSGVCFQFYQQ